MTKEEIEAKIAKTPLAPEGSHLIPFPWQDDGDWYPEYEQFGQLFKNVQNRNPGRAQDYVYAYHEFRNMILGEKQVIKASLLGGLHALPRHIIKDEEGNKDILIHLKDVTDLLLK